MIHQHNDSIKMLEYANSTLGIMTSYPSDWKVKKENTGVMFSAPPTTGTNVSQAVIRVSILPFMAFLSDISTSL
jgi:hypothetical protein